MRVSRSRQRKGNAFVNQGWWMGRTVQAGECLRERAGQGRGVYYSVSGQMTSDIATGGDCSKKAFWLSDMKTWGKKRKGEARRT